ncbi:response regulator transcription factor [Noviherbaspirillum aridicola]|uniref:DNA-binding response regulator n=1 Tax=Noviherbaspirillum aridicola TaxID=2849687 RepID=A0ABQ4Q9R1_9BURK|nr:winged helix-turn-helix domain-containing protein [Noviherbaspirillum aridicola]GIZ53500.1 DNA-binding response regulator [Noviherbaspirillum aridicola]
MQIAVFIHDKREAALACDILRARGHACEVPGMRELEPALRDSALALSDLHQARHVLPALRRLRDDGALLPLLLVAGADEQAGIAAALADGADDFLLTPLRRGELAARVAILLARFHPQPQQQEVFGDYAFDIGQRRVTARGQAVTLTQKEFDLALLFFRHLGRPLSRAYLQEAIWPGQEDAGRSVDTHVSRVRGKLDLRPAHGFRLAPVYSFGYRLERLGG